jgi:hypothetical protein
MQSIRLVSSAVVILMGMVISASAQVVVYNSFGPGNSYDTTTKWAVSGASTSGGYRGQAEAFTPGISGDLSSIVLATAHINGSALSDFFIAQDNGSGAPGTILESFSSTQNANGLLTLNSVAQPLLQAGTQYWLCDEPSTSTSLNGWYENNQGQNGFAFERSEWGWSAVAGPPASGVFKVSVTAVPEPSAAMLGGLGMTLVWGSRKLKRAQKRSWIF